MACRRTGGLVNDCGCFAVLAGHRQAGSEPCAGTACNVVCGVAVLAQEGCRTVRTAAAVADDVEVLAGCGQFCQTLGEGAKGDVLSTGDVATLPLVVSRTSMMVAPAGTSRGSTWGTAVMGFSFEVVKNAPNGTGGCATGIVVVPL